MSKSSKNPNDVDAVDERGWTALHHAADEGDVSEVERLLAAGANVDARTTAHTPEVARNSTPLIVATTYKHFDVMRLLLDHGADIDARNDLRWTPLFYAVYNGPLKSIDYLIWKGANVKNVDKYSVSMLHKAVELSVDAVVVCETLVACGSDIDATNNVGDTPLMRAVTRETIDVVRSLLALNADTTKTAADGWDVSRTRNAEILQLLSEHSKKSALEREQTRAETLTRARFELGTRFMQFAHHDIIGICLALAPLDLPPYVLLWIVDWLPHYDLLSHRKKIHLIESVVRSIRKVAQSL